MHRDRNKNIKQGIREPLDKEIHDIVYSNKSGIPFDLKEWKIREEFRGGKSWHLPSKELIEVLLEYSPILSVGCGLAYTESKAIEAGADIICTDAYSDTNNYCKGKYYLYD